MNKSLLSTFILGIILLAGFYYLDKGKIDKDSLPRINSSDQQNQSEVDRVSEYIKDNIKTLAPDSPVLGGSWYVVSISINESNKTGEVVYEDGHIQSKASFKYIINQGADSINILDIKSI